MTDPDTALIIFAREPEEGKVKTRLAADGLSAAEVTDLYKAFVRDVLAVGQRAHAGQKFLYFSSGKRGAPFLESIGGSFILRQQADGDLGQKMTAAFRECFDAGAGRVVILGTDCLTVTARDIGRAFDQLAEVDVVLGPAADGGYYLIGLNRAVPAIFAGVAWGMGDVLAQTLARAREKELRVTLLEEQVDIDTAEDLGTFMKSVGVPGIAPYTREALQNLKFQ